MIITKKKRKNFIVLFYFTASNMNVSFVKKKKKRKRKREIKNLFFFCMRCEIFNLFCCCCCFFLFENYYIFINKYKVTSYFSLHTKMRKIIRNAVFIILYVFVVEKETYRISHSKQKKNHIIQKKKQKSSGFF